MKNKWKDIGETFIGFVIGAALGLGIFYVVDNYFAWEYYYFDNLILHGINEKKITIEEKNKYYRDYNFEYVQTTNTFFPTNHQDIRNIFYTFLNSGQEEFTFYCPKNYKECMDEVNDIIYDEKKSEIGNIYVFNHPFNDYKTIQLSKLTKAGQNTLKVKKKYKKEDIEKIEKEVDRLFNQLYDKNKSDYDNIKTIHDYLVENVEYDSVKSDFIKKKSDTDSIYHSDSAYGPLFEGYGICSGYTDTMLLFLEKMHIKNYRIATKTHIWNAVQLDGTWYHIDLTWDEGKYTNGKTFVRDKYFMITTEQLLENDQEIHNFDQNIYLELKQ
ncbi:MAG: hypothetical protein IJ193_05555 [Bacilli bacterium]|nr:hypothetical protein [Bacilli bacterium]